MSVRRIVSLLGIAFAAALLYAGTYLPYRKAAAIIRVHERLQSVQTVNAFLGMLEEVLALPSPYGQEEETRFLGEKLFGAVSAQADPRAVNAFVAYAERILEPFLDRGASPTQTRFLLGRIHQAAWAGTGEARYAGRSEDLYLGCLEASPRRPQCLYALLRLYESGNKRQQAKLVAEEILKYWPTETRARKILTGPEERP